MKYSFDNLEKVLKNEKGIIPENTALSSICWRKIC